MHEVLVNRLGGLSLPRKSVVRLTDRPDMTLDVYRGRKTTMQQAHPEAEIREYVREFQSLIVWGKKLDSYISVPVPVGIWNPREC